MTVTIENAEYARQLSDAIEEGLQGDGTHIGITDSELVVKALRRLFVELIGGAPELPEMA